MVSRRWVRRSAVVPAVVVLLGGGGGLAWATAGAATPTYRTAGVVTGDVEQLLTLTGTTRNVHQATSAFPVTGTVASVTTQAGATVSQGQTLATLDPGPLQKDVIAATATLARARATLETDQASGTTSSAGTPGTDTPSTAARTVAAAPTPTPAAGIPTAAGGARGSTPAVSSALADTSRLLTLAQSSLAAVTSACRSSSAPAPASPTPTPTLTGSPTAETAPAAATPAGGCMQALEAALAAQKNVSAAQVTAERALQSAAVASAASSGSTAAGPATAPRSTASSSPTTSAAPPVASGIQTGGGQGGASTLSTAARLTNDQAAVAAAQVALDVAHRNLAGATLTSPLAGKVASQPFTVGAASGSSAIVIVAPGAVEVTVDVPASSLLLVSVGQPAAVTPDGSTTASAGTVSAVGLLPTSSSSGSSTTYPVRVLVATADSAFAEGGMASVAITVKAVHGVLTVPNSAVSDGTVTVLSAGKPVRTRVQTGAVGPLATEVTSGLKAGQQVVLADLGAALPANSTTTTRGFGGTGGPAGGFTGGAPGGSQGGAARGGGGSTPTG
jgi:HlyD family secretion protein